MEQPGNESFSWGTLNAEDLLVCAMCMKYFNDPRVLTCDHSFCRPCLQTYFDSRQAQYGTRIATMPCPTCQNRVHLPLIGISGLPLDSRIKRAKEVFISQLMEDVKHRPPPPDPPEVPEVKIEVNTSVSEGTSSNEQVGQTENNTQESEITSPVAPPRKKRGRSQTRKSESANGEVKTPTGRRPSYSSAHSSPSGRSSSLTEHPPREPSPFSVVRDPVWSDFSPPPRDFECNTPKPNSHDPSWGQFPRRRSSACSPKSPKLSPSRTKRTEREKDAPISPSHPPFSPPTVVRDDSWNSFSVSPNKETPERWQDSNTAEKKTPTKINPPKEHGDPPHISKETLLGGDTPPRSPKKEQIAMQSPTNEPPCASPSSLPRSSTEPDLAFNNSKPKMRDKSTLLAQDKERPKSYASILEPHLENFSFSGLKRSNSDRLRSRRTQELEDEIHNAKDGHLPSPSSRTSRFIRRNSRRFKANRNGDGKADTTAYNGRTESPLIRGSAYKPDTSRFQRSDPFHSDPDTTFHSDTSGTSTPQSSSTYERYRSSSPVSGFSTPRDNSASFSHHSYTDTPSHTGSSRRTFQTPTRSSRFSKKRPEGTTFEEEFAKNTGGASFHNRTTLSPEPPPRKSYTSNHAANSNAYKSEDREPRFNGRRTETLFSHTKFESPHTSSPNTNCHHDEPGFSRDELHKTDEPPPEPKTSEKEPEVEQPYKPKIRTRKTHFSANPSDTNNNDGSFSSPYDPKVKRWSMPAHSNTNSSIIQKYLNDSDEEEEEKKVETREETLDDVDGSGLVSDIVIEEVSKVNEVNNETGKCGGEVIFQMMPEDEMEVIQEERAAEGDVGKSTSNGEQDYLIEELTVEVETEVLKVEEEEQVEELEEVEEEEEQEEEEEEEVEPDTADEEDFPDPVYEPAEPQLAVEKMENEQPTSLAVLNSGKVVVADYNHNQLLFYNKEGEIEFQLDGMKPYSIAVDHTGNVLVGDRKNKTVKSFDEFGADVNAWPDDILDWVSGIAVLSDKTIVVLDRQYCKVKLFSPSGDHLSEFGSYGTRDKQLAMADFLTVDSNDRIIVCDSGNHCVKVFDREGKLLLMFGGRGRLKGELQWPKGICVDDKDNIIVADTKNNRVCMFSPEGEYIQRVVKNIPNAYAVSFTKPNQLGVTQFTMNGESEFKVFKIEEKLGDLTLDSEL